MAAQEGGTTGQEFDRLSASGVVAVLTLRDIRHAEPLAAALAEGGIRFVEVALRTPASVHALPIFAEHPDLRVGAGTVISPGQVDDVLDAGADFIVSPGFDRGVVARCRRDDVPVLPGIATPTEAMRAVREGVDAVKVFPAEPLGGPGYLKALSGPFPHLRWVPTGGIDERNAADYLRMRSVLAIGGSWMAPADLVKAERFDEIRALARQAAALAARSRDGSVGTA
jgi:2-dehydro-3-deoxyphosphogluconate aldolase/(4S)-4-hydroxy-2-oxoglutarate aldolase